MTTGNARVRQKYAELPGSQAGLSRSASSTGCVAVLICTPGAISTPFPIVIVLLSMNVQRKLTETLSPMKMLSPKPQTNSSPTVTFVPTRPKSSFSIA